MNVSEMLQQLNDLHAMQHFCGGQSLTGQPERTLPALFSCQMAYVMAALEETLEKHYGVAGLADHHRADAEVELAPLHEVMMAIYELGRLHGELHAIGRIGALDANQNIHPVVVAPIDADSAPPQLFAVARERGVMHGLAIAWDGPDGPAEPIH